MAATRSKAKTEDLCAETLRRLPEEKRAAWLGFLRAHSAVVRGLDGDLIANFGVPLSAFQVLFGVAESEEGYLRMSEVAEQARLSPSRASRVVSELERRGLLERRACESDTRVVYAAITGAGRALASKLERLHFEGIERRFFSALSNEQVAALAELWPRVLEASAAPA
jgi:DNA-binding MarR family transcriptional regulator